MKRAELREHIFKVIFGLEFNEEDALAEQIELYFDQLEEDAKEKDLEYIRTKVQKISENV